MKKESTPSFVYTLKLRYCENQGKRLDKIFRYCNNIYNDLVRDRTKVFETLVETSEYKCITEAMRLVYEDDNLSKQDQARALKELGKERTQLLQDANISKYGLCMK